jgi:hypothetical protein
MLKVCILLCMSQGQHILCYLLSVDISGIVLGDFNNIQMSGMLFYTLFLKTVLLAADKQLVNSVMIILHCQLVFKGLVIVIAKKTETRLDCD